MGKSKIRSPKLKQTSKPKAAKSELLLGLDVGTSGLKALLIDDSGRVVAEEITEYPMLTLQPLWVEQSPESWWLAATRSMRAVLRTSGIRPDRIAGIGLTGQMHGLVLLDARGEVLRPCIMWNDQRTAGQCSVYTKKIGLTRLLELTGNPLLPGFTAPKIAWVRENEPGVAGRIDKILLPKDYIRYRLTGQYYAEVSDASGTLLFDVARRRWSDEMLRVFKVRRSWLPEVTESSVASAQVSAEAARATGLRAGTPVVGGAGDQAAGAVGVGAIAEGIVAVVIGTSGVVFASCHDFQYEPQGRLHAFCHAVPGMWHIMGVMLAAGGSFRWFRDTLGDTERRQAERHGLDAYDLLTRSAATVPAGAAHLYFLPYLSGERTPYPDPNARGVFFGLNLKHTRAHMTRAVLEGVSFGLRDSLELIRALRVPIREIRVVGGGARSALWRQILADVFEEPVHTVSVTQGAAFGAALLAGVGAGIYVSVEDACNKTVRTKQAAVPGEDAVVYQRHYPHYQALYKALKDEFKAMAELQEAEAAQRRAP